MFSRSLMFPFLTTLFLAGFVSLGFGEEAKPNEDEKKASDQIAQWIEQLGSPSYTEREMAESELLKRGTSAFVPLFGARNHADPEIAFRARYLARKLQANLVLPEDSSKVASLMRNIFSLDPSQQNVRISELSRAPNGEGLGALCRLVIFSESESFAKLAAQGLMQSRLHDKPNPAPGIPQLGKPQLMTTPNGRIKVIRQPAGLQTASSSAPGIQAGRPLGQKERDKIRGLLKSCDRPAAKIVCTYFDFADAKTDAEKKALYGKWKEYCAAEVKAEGDLQKKMGEGPSTSAWLQFLAEVQLAKAIELSLDDEEVIAMTYIQLAKNPFWERYRYKEMITVLVEEEAWKPAGVSLLEFCDLMKQAFGTDRIPRFCCVLMREGKTEAANKIIDIYINQYQGQSIQASKLGMDVAAVLAQEGFTDQAVAQYKSILEKPEMKRPQHYTISYFRNCYYGLLGIYEEREQFDSAVETADQMVSILKGCAEVKTHQIFIQTLSEAQGSAAYYRAMTEKKKGNEAAYRQELEKAINLDPYLVEALIECYHLPATADNAKSKTFHDRIVEQIKKTEQKLINSTGAVQEQLGRVNQAAWLIAKTEGNVELAVQRLELFIKNTRSSTPGAFDTLAFCCYKMGDLGKAITFQRQAIELDPYSPPIKKAWETYTTAYEKKTGKKPDPPQSGTNRFRKSVGLQPR